MVSKNMCGDRFGFVRQRAAPDEEQHLASASDDAESRGALHFHLRTTEGAGRTCRPPAPRSSSHKAVAASNITILESIFHSKIEVINQSMK